MEQITLKVENIQPVTKKDGTTVEGMGQKGVHWQLFKFNKKYSYFHHGEGLPDYTLGVEYPFELESKQDGQYTNYQISKPKEEHQPVSNDLPLEFIKKGFGVLRGDITRIEKKLDILLEGTGAKPDKINPDIDVSDPGDPKSEWFRSDVKE